MSEWFKWSSECKWRASAEVTFGGGRGSNHEHERIHSSGNKLSKPGTHKKLYKSVSPGPDLCVKPAMQHARISQVQSKPVQQ